MGKYFDGKRFNYIKTGKKRISEDGIRKFVLENNRNSKPTIAFAIRIFLVRSGKVFVMANMGIVKIWRKVANGVGPRFTRSFIALRNLGKKLYEFLDDV